eukprot:5450091-Prymnesium_polylepis.1
MALSSGADCSAPGISPCAPGTPYTYKGYGHLLVTEVGCTSHAVVRPCRDSATRFGHGHGPR